MRSDCLDYSEVANFLPQFDGKLIEIVTFLSETKRFVVPTPYISEVDYNGPTAQDFIEIAVDAGTDVSNMTLTIYRENGVIRSTNSLGAKVATVNGKDIYVIYTQTAAKDALALDDNGTVHQFISFTPGAPVSPTTGAANGLTSVEVGSSTSTGSLETTDGGATYSNQETENPGTIPCLTRGSNILTAEGYLKIEDLQVGMRIQNLKGDMVPLRCILSRVVGREELQMSPKLRPVRILAGALGNGLPIHDLLVSRQHRMLVRSKVVERMFGDEEVLIAAIRLTELPGIYIDETVRDVEYFHLLFDQHEVIIAEEAPTESFFCGKGGLMAVSKRARREITSLFPQLRQSEFEPETNFLIPPNKRQKQLVERHKKNNVAVYELD